MDTRLQIQAKAEPVTAPSCTSVRTNLLYRKNASNGLPPCLAGECLGHHKKQLGLQRRSVSQYETSEVPPIVHEVLRSPGQSLDPATRAYMEPRLGHDFGKVRVHTDAKAAESARAVNARAYTVGSNIVFRAGQYAPNITQGQRMLAHELAHVIQQNGSPSRETALWIANAPNSLENEASENYKRQTNIDSYHSPEQSPSPPLSFSNNGISIQRKPVYLYGGYSWCSEVIQPKLTINQLGDKYEEEADRVTEQVMRMPEPKTSKGIEVSDLTMGSPIQRRCPSIDKPTSQLEKNDKEELLQTKEASGHNLEITPQMDAHISAIHGGQPLPESVRAFFEPRFGYDFSQIRLHPGPEAEALNDDLHSHAFTHGQHIWLGRGETSSNLSLLAHELTHTIQQGAVLPLGGQLRKGAPAAGVILATPHTQPTSIQRSVQETGVRSPESVLLRIGRTLIENIMLPIPLQLYKLGHEFHPGKGVDDPRNAFVYTCRGGWIDMGHFFFTAAGASTIVGAPATWKKALQTEEEQQQERTKFEKMPLSEREKYFGRSWKEATPEQQARRGSAWSAYTIEDLPSDKFGFDFGLSLRPFSNIFQGMVEFFNRQGAVDASRNKNVLKSMMAETLGTKDQEKLPRQHRNTNPVLLASARELCGTR